MLPESRKRKIRKMYGLSCTSLVSRTFFADVFSLLQCLLVLTYIEWMPTTGILNMHARALYAIYASTSKHGTVNITFLYLLLRRAEYLGHENSAFCDSSVVAENIYLRTVVCLDCNFCGCVFEADFLSFYSTWKLRPYKVDVTLFQFVSRKIVCEFWNDSNIP